MNRNFVTFDIDVSSSLDYIRNTDVIKQPFHRQALLRINDTFVRHGGVDVINLNFIDKRKWDDPLLQYTRKLLTTLADSREWDFIYHLLQVIYYKFGRNIPAIRMYFDLQSGVKIPERLATYEPPPRGHHRNLQTSDLEGENDSFFHHVDLI